jgi:adenosyl cobinamide kinase/adenosyl cobinamide phosphate guanylyltransferase
MFAFSGYLAYKYKVGKEIIETYLGNKKLIELEKERDKLMLENIKTAIVNKLTNQHKEKLKEDKKIDKSGVDNKIKEISSIITDHIIRGNEVKFLSYIEKENDEENVSRATAKHMEYPYLEKNIRRVDI